MSFLARRARCATVSLTLAAALMAGLLATDARSAGTQDLSVQDLQQMARVSTDSTQSRSVADRLKAYLASKPDSNYITYTHMVLVQALMTSRAPIRELTAEVERAAARLPDRPEARASFYASVSSHLADRGEALAQAQTYANLALQSCPREPQYRGMVSLTRSTLGSIQLQLGQTAAAIASLKLAMTDSPDSQQVLLRLGRAYEKSGKPDLAIDYYVRSSAVFASRDSSAAAALRVLYLKRNGSLAGLDEKVKAARRAARNRVALDGRRHEKPAPDWSLPDLDGRKVEFASLRGKVVVLDFWGSWCGPCRMELPFFQALYERHRDDKNVAVLSMNWERVESAEEHARTARDYMKKNQFTFPVVYDHDRVAVQSYGIEGFPTVFLIDKTGKIRYRNVGFDPAIDEILEAQIESLLQ